MRILITVDAINPGTEVTGMFGLLNLFIMLGKSGVEVDIITPNITRKVRNKEHYYRGWEIDKDGRDVWYRQQKERSGGKIKFHTINLGRFKNIPFVNIALRRMLILYKTILITRRIRFDVINEYSASPLLLLQTSFYRLFFKGKLFHTICTHLDDFWGKPVLAKLCCNACFLNGVITFSKELYQKLALVLPAEKIKWIPLGYDYSQFNLDAEKLAICGQEIRKNLKIKSHEKVILYLGPLSDRKGVFELALAFRKILTKNADAILVYATAKSSSSSYNNMAKEKILSLAGENKERVRFIEGKHDVPLLMNMADIITVPSRTASGTISYPLTLLEALASGKAIVVSRIPGNSEIISDGENGLIFDNTEDLAKKLDLLLGSPSLRENLGRAAIETSKKYNIIKCAASFIQYYETQI